MATRTLPRLRAALAAAGDPERAEGARRYMKTDMRFHGVAAPALRRICREVFADLELASAGEFFAEILRIWRGARFREEWYAAIELCGVRAGRPFQTPAALPVYEEMIVTGAWWDTVDTIAIHRIGDLLRAHPAALRPPLLSWSRGADLWKRRAAILAQNRFGEETDLPFLYACIAPSLSSTEFFLRKAIGWALRQVAWWNPAETRRYVAENEAVLSGLSRREALKSILGKKTRPAR